MNDYGYELSPYRNSKSNGSPVGSAAVAVAAAAATAPSIYGTGSLMSSIFATTGGQGGRSTSPRMGSTGTLVALQRREKYLQRELQALLDAQSDGLLRGLQSEGNDDRNIAPTDTGPRPLGRGNGDDGDGSSVMAAAVRRRAGKRNVPLRQTRQAICHVMRDLAAIKAAEVDALAADEEANASVLVRMEHWDKKRIGLDRELERIEHQSIEAKRATEARAETDALGSEIRDLEQKLAELRQRHNHAREEAERLENRVQAQLSSFREARVLLDKEVKEFVTDPPAQGVGLGLGLGLGGAGHAAGRRRQMNGNDSIALVEEPEAVYFASISPKRRTYELAKEVWKAEQKQLTSALKRVTLEQEALEEGSRLWESVSSMVTVFESDLKTGLEKIGERSSMILPSSSSSSSPPPLTMPGDSDNTKSMEKLATRMDKAIRELESSYRIAEEKGWKLLLCSIGAELEAFTQGRRVLKDSLGLTGGSSRIEQADKRNGDEFREMMKELSVQEQNTKAFDEERQLNVRETNDTEHLTNNDDVDEEPDPELMHTSQDNYID